MRSSGNYGPRPGYFRAQPGFVSLRRHRAMTQDARYRFANVAQRPPLPSTAHRT
jgi:hypothetical protein